MSISERQRTILSIIDEKTYVTVNELAQILFTSSSSIRRDLTSMQKQGLVRRSHGGVTLFENSNTVASFYNRSKKSVKEKRAIAKKAAELLHDGMSIFLDSSTTAGFLLPYIAKLERATVFTNNLQTALNASQQGIDVHCLGGHASSNSSALVGAQTCTAISNLSMDIVFFSSQALDINGTISDSTEEENYVRKIMLKQSKKKVFLCDSEKFSKSSLYKLATLEEIDFAVFDRAFEGLETSTTILLADKETELKGDTI